MNSESFESSVVQAGSYRLVWFHSKLLAPHFTARPMPTQSREDTREGCSWMDAASPFLPLRVVWSMLLIWASDLVLLLFKD